MSQSFYTPSTWIENTIEIVVLGAGGTGGEVVNALARMHVQLRSMGFGERLHVTLMDGDTVSPSNIGRQRFAACDIGHNKALVLIHRLNFFYSLNWHAIPYNWTPVSPEPNWRHCDLLVTCVDHAQTRVKLAQEGAHFSPALLWLDFGNGRFTGQCVLGHLGVRSDNGALRLPNVFDLYPELASIDDTDKPSCSATESLLHQDLFVNSMLAVSGVSLLWRLLRHGSIQSHGAHVDVSEPSVEPLPIDPAAWAFYSGTRPHNSASTNKPTAPPRRRRARKTAQAT